jgi:hypothetical protein
MQQKLAQVVRALEPANGDVNLPVGQEAAVRPAPGPAPEPAARPAESIEDAVEKALEELRTPESLVPAWHMEDQTARIRAGLGPHVPASPGPDISTEPRFSQPVGSAPAQVSSAQTAPVEARRHGRMPAQFFDHAKRQSDFSTFMQWVEREKGEARK